jgi:cation:H+ antiporter
MIAFSALIRYTDHDRGSVRMPNFFTGGTISRLEGVLFLGYYEAYTPYLILAAAQHDALPKFSAVILYLAIPLTMVTLIIVAVREIRIRNQRQPK